MIVKHQGEGMKHFVIDKKSVFGDIVILEGEEYHYLKNVRRIKIGDYIKGLIEDEIMILYIKEIKKSKIILTIVNKTHAYKLIKPEITVMQGMIKSKKMDLLISRLSEIGVKEIYPVITERSILKGEIGKNKIDRWERLAKEGSKISGLERVLKVNPPQNLNGILRKSMDDFEYKLLFSTNTESVHIKVYLETISDPVNKSFCLFFGPEGGFSKNEENNLVKQGFTKVNMGPFIMRAETAAIAATTFIRIFYSNELNRV